MADVRPLLLSVLRAIGRLHAKGETLFTMELAVESMAFDGNGEVVWQSSYERSYQHNSEIVSVFDSPEVLLDPKLVSVSNDVWAFGCYFSFLLRGTYVFKGTTKNSMLITLQKGSIK